MHVWMFVVSSRIILIYIYIPALLIRKQSVLS